MPSRSCKRTNTTNSGIPLFRTCNSIFHDAVYEEWRKKNRRKWKRKIKRHPEQMKMRTKIFSFGELNVPQIFLPHFYSPQDVVLLLIICNVNFQPIKIRTVVLFSSRWEKIEYLYLTRCNANERFLPWEDVLEEPSVLAASADDSLALLLAFVRALLLPLLVRFFFAREGGLAVRGQGCFWTLVLLGLLSLDLRQVIKKRII